MKLSDDFYTPDKDLRKGKWTTEEENYSNKIIMCFNQGLLSIPVGTTLRSYLSEKLSCDPMRITKKFAGALSIGKQVFHSCDETPSNIIYRREHINELDKLERLFKARIQSKLGTAHLDRHQRYEQQQLSQQAPVSASSPRGTKNKHNPTFDSSVPPPPPPTYLQSPDSVHTSNDLSFSSEYYVNDSNRSSFSSHHPHDSDLYTSGVFQKNKRIMSAPDLTQLSLLASSTSQISSQNNSGTSTAASVSLSSSINDDYFGIAYKAAQQTSGTLTSASLFMNGNPRKSPAGKLPKGKSGTLGTSSRGGTRNSKSNVKKSQSMVDLGHYEKMAEDDRAAGEMFLQFVQALGDKYVDRDHLSLSTNESSRPMSVNSTNEVAIPTGNNSISVQRNAASNPSPTTSSVMGTRFMTIDDVISATVAEDFSSFSMAEASFAAGQMSSGVPQLSQSHNMLQRHSPDSTMGLTKMSTNTLTTSNNNNIHFMATTSCNESKVVTPQSNHFNAMPSSWRSLPSLTDLSAASSATTLDGSADSQSMTNLLHCDSPMLLSTTHDGASGRNCGLKSSSLSSTQNIMTPNSQEVTQQFPVITNIQLGSHHHSSSGGQNLESDIFVDQSATASQIERLRVDSEEGNFF